MPPRQPKSTVSGESEWNTIKPSTKNIARIQIKKKIVLCEHAETNKSPTIIKDSREDIEELVHKRLYDDNPNETEAIEPETLDKTTRDEDILMYLAEIAEDEMKKS